jgi:hypothetical protein
MALATSCKDGDSGGAGGGSGSGDSGSEGKGGSMARFAVIGDFLFTVDQSKLKMFNISDSKHPVLYDGRTQGLEFGVETVFPMDSLLFIGSQDGMYIYRLSDRGFLQYLSKTSHIRSCDPVVAQENYAYVTLNSNSVACGRTSNLLQIYDITNLRDPQRINETLGFTSPMGLGIDNDKLFICDEGLKVFDITNRTSPEQIDDNHSAGLHDITDAYDVIPLGGRLMLVASSGIYMLDYSGESLKLLDKIEIKR